MNIAHKAPYLHKINKIDTPKFEMVTLDNGINVYIFRSETLDIFKLDIVYTGGRLFEKKKLASKAAFSLLKDSTKMHTGAEIAELIDYYGASVSTSSGMDLGGIELYGMYKYFGDLLPVVFEMITKPRFSQKDISTFKRLNKQKLKQDLMENDVLSFRDFTEAIFGSDHPYGYNGTLELYNAVEREMIVEHYESFVSETAPVLFFVGKARDSELALLNDTFGKLSVKNNPDFIKNQPCYPDAKDIAMRGHGRYQASIKMGKKLFNRHHPDFNGMMILNTILGGYFGSRLMANIREKKGLTYNIYSQVESLLTDGYFYIGVDTDKENISRVSDEIYKEIYKLQQKPVSKHELEMVKNYLMGILLNYTDGPFNKCDTIKSFVIEGLPIDYFQKFIEVIQNITPDDIMKLSTKYLDPNALTKVIVS